MRALRTSPAIVAAARLRNPPAHCVHIGPERGRLHPLPGHDGTIDSAAVTVTLDVAPMPRMFDATPVAERERGIVTINVTGSTFSFAAVGDFLVTSVVVKGDPSPA